MISVIFDDFSHLNDLFDKNHHENKSKYINILLLNNNKEIFDKNVNIDTKETIRELIKNTQKILHDNNFKINPSNYFIEFHKYVVNGKSKPFFDFHEDDGGNVSYKTVTCIYYLMKSNTINGGDLEFKNDKIINIESNMLVIFNGNLTHRVTMMDGIGIRKCIVIQFERL